MSEIDLINDSITRELVDTLIAYDLYDNDNYSIRIVSIKDNEVNILKENIYIKINTPVNTLEFGTVKKLIKLVNDYTKKYQLKAIISHLSVDELIIEKLTKRITNEFCHNALVIRNYGKENHFAYDVLLHIDSTNFSKPKVVNYKIKNKDNKNILKNLIKIDELGITMHDDLLSIFYTKNAVMPLLRQFKEYDKLINDVAFFNIISFDTKVENMYLKLDCIDNLISFQSDISTYGFTNEKSLSNELAKIRDIGFACGLHLNEKSPLKEYKITNLSNTQYLNTKYGDEFNKEFNKKCVKSLKDYFNDVLDFNHIDELVINMSDNLAYANASSNKENLLIFNNNSQIIGCIPLKAIKNIDTFISKYKNFIKLYKDLIAIPTFKKY